MDEIIQCFLFILCAAVLMEVLHHIYKYYLAYRAHSNHKSSLHQPGILEVSRSENGGNQDNIPPSLQPFQNTQSDS